MIWNIIDNRKRRYRWAKVTAIIEPTYHDNSCIDSDQAPETIDGTYDALPEISLADAVSWAQGLQYPVTLFLYDLGHGINGEKEEGTEHFKMVSNRFDTE